MQVINQARATNGVRVQRGFEESTKLCLPRGFIPLRKYYVIVTVIQTSENDNHTANSCSTTNIFKLDVIKNHRGTSSNILSGNKSEMIMESIDYGRDLLSASDIVLLPVALYVWLFTICDKKQNKDMPSIHMH